MQARALMRWLGRFEISLAGGGRREDDWGRWSQTSVWVCDKTRE